ncbi:THAP domain-containing protein 2-like [Argiope bruennichi]|uniref:THAP domain-containing protein 2-like n=1 Tax=Argiope bruennichi TaxID=94029 RepID=UPI00249507E6|nr:THAP domain-containing protein 2-like [Argiope bruennichi]
MPSACCVPNCKSNYTKNSPNISVFSFPRDENTRRAWISAIKRDNFVPTKYSKVCAKHFPENQFLTVREAFNTSTGELIQVPMEYKRLVPGAVPSIFPNLPSYFSSESKARRETPMDRATRKDMENLKAALNSSPQDIAKKRS